MLIQGLDHRINLKRWCIFPRSNQCGFGGVHASLSQITREFGAFPADRSVNYNLPFGSPYYDDAIFLPTNVFGWGIKRDLAPDRNEIGDYPKSQ